MQKFIEKRKIISPYKDRTIINCRHCSKDFSVFPYLRNTARFCSLGCRVRYIGEMHRMENHFAWKGEKASYRAKHHWMNNNFGKPCTCEHCGNTNLSGHQIHWANVSGEYKRERSDWKRLCSTCHGKFDHPK